MVHTVRHIFHFVVIGHVANVHRKLRVSYVQAPLTQHDVANYINLLKES